MIEKRGWGTRICVPGPLPRRSLPHFEMKARGIVPVPSTCSSHPTPSVDDGNTQKNRTRARECAEATHPLFSLPPTLKRRHREASPCRHPIPHTPPHPLTMETRKTIGHEHANMHTRPPLSSPSLPL